MGDYFPGKILIGGDLTPEMAEQLAEEIEGSGAGLSYDNPGIDRDGAIAAIEEAASRGEPIELASSQASYGRFEELEAFCVEHRLPFLAHSDSFHENDARIHAFDPARMTKSAWCHSNSKEMPLIPLRKALAMAPDELRAKYEIFDRPPPPVRLLAPAAKP